MKVLIESAGGKWTAFPHGRPWEPVPATKVLLGPCASDRSLQQFEELAYGPGYPHPDNVAQKLVSRWQSLGYSAQISYSAGSSAIEKDRYQSIFEASSTILSQAIVRSKCF
jgi:hypothetical protein